MSIDKLNRFINNENLVEYKNYTLDNIILLLKYYGNPHEKIKTIHIAGTNGKGSTAYMLNSILIESDYRTGLFISPHLQKINERMQINNIQISDEDLYRYIDDVVSHIEKIGNINPTYFDIITLIGFRYFFDNHVDVSIIETGLGGRLDSTNVITPVCSIISDISLDHCDILGNNLEAITIEKSGIIKKNIPIVTSNTDETIIKVLQNKCDIINTNLILYNKNYFSRDIEMVENGYKYNFQFVDKIKNKILNDVKINLKGYFQIKNSSMVIASLMCINMEFKKITDSSIKNGLANLSIPGRFQTLSKTPLIIFDPAHNFAAVSSTIDTIKNFYGNRKNVFIITLMKDKDYKNIIPLIIDNSDYVFYYELNDSRSYKPSVDNGQFKFDDIINNQSELKKMINEYNSNNSLFVFTGSFRLYEAAMDCAN